MNNLPLTGQIVKCKYYEIDELEAKCWIEGYQCSGIVENKNLSISLMGTNESLMVSDVNYDTFDIKLIRM